MIFNMRQIQILEKEFERLMFILNGVKNINTKNDIINRMVEIQHKVRKLIKK